MLFIVGLVVVMGCVLSGYVLHNGKLAVLWQPTEVLIICGAAVGATIIGNPKDLLISVLKGFGTLFKGKPFKKDHYIELLTMLGEVFKLIRSKGMLEIEQHLENPHESELFSKYPVFLHNHHALDFLCDYLRLFTMGMDNQYQLDDLMTQELDAHHEDLHSIASSVTTMGESFPALGIVAAVLGVIITMGSITEPPEILGGLIGAALVGTFLGILVSYGIVGPIGQFMGKYYEAEGAYYECIKVALLAHIKGNAPVVSVEFGRKVVPHTERPSFVELEAAMSGGSEDG